MKNKISIMIFFMAVIATPGISNAETLQFFDSFSSDISCDLRDYRRDEFFVVLTTSPPDPSWDVYEQLKDESVADGYTKGGMKIPVRIMASSGRPTIWYAEKNPIWKIKFTIHLRCAVLVARSADGKTRRLIGWWDYGYVMTGTGGVEMKMNDIMTVYPPSYCERHKRADVWEYE